MRGKAVNERLILVNETDLPMATFLDLAMKTIRDGRISNNGKEYCYLTAWIIDGVEYHVVSDKNKASDKLTFYKVPK